ncbi:hypothetical protein BJM39_32275 [Salmonella enterica subsp. enterica serovar Javiana]|nr:hypothetical protein BJM39_32275 [Salmonella enterica subsp. enterica serovar Javiana]
MFAVSACGARVIYAGPGPGRMMVTAHRLGWAVDWDAGQVAAAMTEALASPATPQEAEALTAWTQANASQDTVARRAAQAVAESLDD